MFYIFEMANNHMGDMSHAKLIIDKFSELAHKYRIKSGIKFQFRQLDTFIHKAFINSDLKYIKRFKETMLTKEQFKELADYVRQKKLTTIATPFDNESLPWLDSLDIEVVKIASCSVDDWPLLREVASINKKIIISTGGSTIETLNSVYNLFKSRNRDFSFMHCVGEYPSSIEVSNLNRINLLKQEFPDVEIGFSTHENPSIISMIPYAVAMGCSIIEKHVGVKTKKYSLNDYSCSPKQMEKILREVDIFQRAYSGISFSEIETLRKLKRGIYLRRNKKNGEILKEEDVYFAMPLQEEQLDVSMISKCINKRIVVDLFEDDILKEQYFESSMYNGYLTGIKNKTINMLGEAGISIKTGEEAEISCHYGIENFWEVGIVIISKINREYCKKIIAMMPGQSHPVHKHLKKEECFELLYGDCTVMKDGIPIILKKGEPVLIPRNTNHSFASEKGCVIEEVSTTHYIGDSIYQDYNINKLDISERKIIISL